MKKDSYFVCCTFEDSYFLEIRKMAETLTVVRFDTARPRIIDSVVKRLGLSWDKEKDIIIVHDLVAEGPYDPWMDIHSCLTWVEISKEEYESILSGKYHYFHLIDKYPGLCRRFL